MIKVKHLQLIIRIGDKELSPLEFDSLLIKEGILFVPICEIHFRSMSFDFLKFKSGTKIEISYSFMDNPFVKLEFVLNNIIIDSLNIKEINYIVSGILSLDKFLTEIKQEIKEKKTLKEVITSFNNIKVKWDSSLDSDDKQNWIRYNLSEFMWLKSILPFINLKNDTPLLCLTKHREIKMVALKERLDKPPKAKLFLTKTKLGDNEYQIHQFRYETDNSFKFLFPKGSYIKVYDYLTKKAKNQPMEVDSDFEVKAMRKTHIWLGNTYKEYWKTKIRNISNWVDFLSENVIITLSQGWIPDDKLDLLDTFLLQIDSDRYQSVDKINKKWVITQKQLIINSDSTISYKIIGNTLR